MSVCERVSERGFIHYDIYLQIIMLTKSSRGGLGLSCLSRNVIRVSIPVFYT